MSSAATASTGWKSHFPFQAQWFEHDSHRMHYVDEGSGPPLICVHGNPTWSFMWRKVITEFSSDHRVIAVDHIGCGLSDKPQNYDYCLATHIENLANLIESLALSDVTLVAHDWGGPIGLGALLRHRDKFKRIVLLNTAAFPPPYCPLRIRACRWPLIGEFGVRGLNLFARAAVTMAVHKTRMPRDIRDGFLAPYCNWHDRIAVVRFVQDIALSSKHKTWPVLNSLERDLKQLEPLPTQLIWGMQDWCFNKTCIDRMCDIFPHTELARLADAGHYVVEDAPEEVIGHLREFLANSPLPSSTQSGDFDSHSRA